MNKPSNNPGNLSTWSIHHPVPVLALFMVLCIVGLAAFKQLPITRFPNIDVPVITVSVAQPGAAPSELISQVTKPIEDQIASLSGIKHITSVATDSLSVTTIQFEFGTDTDRALNDVKDAVSNIRSSLPGSITEPVIKRLDVTGMPILTYAVYDPTRSIEDLSYAVDNDISRQLQTIPGVGSVTRKGGADREIKVELDPDRLLALGITASEVSNQLRTTNINLGAGRGDLGGQEFSIRTLGSATSVSQLAATPLALSNGRTVMLGDLGKVVDGPAEARTFAMLDGQPVVSMSVLRSPGASDVAVAQGVQEKIKSIREQNPNLRFTVIDNTTLYTLGSYTSSMETLYEGAALAVLVVLVFLRNWRATLITAVALPLSIIPTFFLMQWMGFSLNIISLLGITLVTGILVDDAIVEIENIVRHGNMGKSAREAAEQAASEIGLTVIAISLTIVAVFTPVSFMGGIPGQYFKQFGLTVAIAVLFSLLVARLVTPMLAAYILRDSHQAQERNDGFLMRHYLGILKWTLSHRFITLVLGALLFALSLFSATLLPTDFVPVSDESRSMLSLELPPGSTLQENRQVSRQISTKIHTLAEVKSVFINGGSDDINNSQLTINYVSPDQRNLSSTELGRKIKQLVADIPDIRTYVLKPNGQRDLSIIVQGNTEEDVANAARLMVKDMKKLPQLTGVSASATLPKPEIRITPKPNLAAELGITASTIASTIQVATLGDTDAKLPKFNAGDRQIPIMVRMNEDARQNLLKMSGLRIPSATGKAIPLGVVADVELRQGPGKLELYDQHYRTTIEANLTPGNVLGPALQAVQATQTAKNMPTGTSLQNSGDAEVMGEVFAGFALAMGLGVLLVLVVLIILFDSFITPITILLSLPLSIGGAMFALYITNKPISLPVVIGILMLIGIVTKNAIMLVEFAVTGISQGLDRNTAMLEAAHKRARPIIMTSIAMIAGMLPSALALGMGGEFRSPMAVAVIGGLAVSTVLSLLFVPSMFSVIDKVKEKARASLVKFLGNDKAAKEKSEQSIR